MLLDESVALMGADPVRWLALGLLPSLPLALLLIAHLFLHRVVWLDQAWEPVLTIQSGCVALAVVLAWQLRAAAQGRLARAVVETLHPAALLETDDAQPPRGRIATGLSLACLATVGLTGSLVGLCLVVLPGLALAGFFVPMPAIVAVEQRDAGAAISRAARLPRGTTGKGMTSVVLFGALTVLAWLNIMFGAQVAIFGARAFVGLDVSILARLFGLGNEVFVLGSLVVALLVLDPLWGIQRSLVYLDARLGQSGADLTERWRMLPRRRRRDEVPTGPSVVLQVALAITALASAAPSYAQSTASPSWLPTSTTLEAYTDELEFIRDSLDEAIDRYPTSGFEDLATVRAQIELGAGPRSVRLPDGGSWQLDGTLLAEELPTWIHTDATLVQARRISDRLGDAIDAAQRISDPTRSPANESTPPRALLAEELAGGDYDVDEVDVAGDDFRDGIQQRFRTWWESVIRSLDTGPKAPPQSPGGPILPSFDGRIVIAAVAIILAVLLLVFFLSQSLRIAVRAPTASAGTVELGGDLPDARQRTPLGWRAHGDTLAAEGLFDEAIRALFLAVLARLDRTREIEYRQERTNGEHLRSFRGGEARLCSFEDATVLFEVAWYGSGLVSRDDYASMATACEPLLSQEPPEVGQARPLLSTEVADGR